MLARERALRIALAEARAGVMETGANTGKRVKQYQSADGHVPSPDTGYDWCVSFIVWCYREARRELTETERSPSVPRTATLARSEGWVVRKPKRGDIVCIQLPPDDSTPDHIGIVVEPLADGSVRTVEGNTGGNGGQGVFEKSRTKAECETFIRVPGRVPTGLGRGDHGPEVKNLQRQLVRLGHASLEADGDFGERTEKSVARFQSRHGLEETGIATRATLTAIERALHPPEPTPVGRGVPAPRFDVLATFADGDRQEAERIRRAEMNRKVNSFLAAGARSVKVTPTA